MARTLLQAVQNVSQNVGLDATVASFSDTDETNLLVLYINEAYEGLLVDLPNDCPYLDTTASISLVAGTRTYSLASDAAAFDLYDWSFLDTSNTYSRISFATKEYVQDMDSQYTVTQGIPTFVYVASGSTLGFYPIPNTSGTVTYEYGASPPTRLSSVSATFIIPDRWVRYLEKMAEAKYKTLKSYGDAQEVMAMALDMRSDILIENWEVNQTYLTNEGIT